MSSASAPLPLAGMTVLELTRAWAGPFCGMMLADMGAEVIKVEPPGETPEARGGFPYVSGESVIFMMLNRNKKSITLDLKDPVARGTFVELVREADVLVQNFRPGALDELGLGYDDLHAVNPRLIYTTITGYGRKGPQAQDPAVDQIAMAVTGLHATTMSDATARPSGLGVPLCDVNAGMWAAHGTLCAYIWRQRSGEGQRVDTSLLEAGLSLMVVPTAMHFHMPGFTGYRTPMNGGSECLLAADGKAVAIFVNFPPLWSRFLAALQEPRLAGDPRFKTREARTANAAALREVLAQIFAAKPAAEWIELLRRAGVPVGPVNTIAETLDEPQVKALGIIREQQHPVGGTIHLLDVPVTLSSSPGSVRTPAPRLGEHNDMYSKS